MRRKRHIGLVLAFSLLLASPAAAQEPGVILDPNGPAGTEYALPVDEARRSAAPDRDPRRARGGGEDSKETPLFGAGVRPPAGSGTSGAGGSGGSSGSGGSGGRDSGSSSGSGTGSSPSDSRPRGDAGAGSTGVDADRLAEEDALVRTAAAEVGWSPGIVAITAVGALLLGGLAGLIALGRRPGPGRRQI